MLDIAERVGVSVKSVSRVLNGEAGTSPDTARRILSTAESLGFRRNELARGLAKGNRTGSVGVVVRHTGTRFAELLGNGVDEVAAARGAFVLTAGAGTPERQRTALLGLSARQVDGLLVAALGADHAYLRPEQAAGTPLVFVDCPPLGIEADTVLADDAGGARVATEHLLDRGHTRIALVGAEGHLWTVRKRATAYRAAVGHRHDAALVALDVDGAQGAEHAVAALLDLPDPPTAVFALNSVCAIGAVRAVAGAGLRHRVEVVGFDDFETADLLDPPLTVVAHDIAAMGRRAAELLFARLDGRAGPPRREVLPVSLLVRTRS